MRKRMIALAWASLIVGIRYGIHYGRLAANTHWVVERSRDRWTVEKSVSERVARSRHLPEHRESHSPSVQQE